MGGGDAGTWKLLIYPIVIILIIGALLNFFVTPFVDNGLNVPLHTSAFTNILSNFVSVGTTILPSGVGDFLSNQLIAFSFLPSALQSIIAIVILSSFAYVAYVLATMLIP